MNYPFLGYNTPGLQLGQQAGLGGAQTQSQSLSNYQVPELTANPGGYQGLSPTFQNIASDTGFSLPSYAQGGNSFSGLGNWASQNTDLLKAGAGLITGGLGAWNGMKQNKLMRQNMNQQASQFREQMDLSKQSINRNLEDRQRARVASNPVAYESVESYKKKYGV